MFHVPEQYRIKVIQEDCDPANGNNGRFMVPMSFRKKVFACVIATDGMGWEHVSVSLMTDKHSIDRSPTWEEMCRIKDLFWDDTDTVVQYHPPSTEYVNNHPHCLHLWRKIGYDYPLPDSLMVGFKNLKPSDIKKLKL